MPEENNELRKETCKATEYLVLLPDHQPHEDDVHVRLVSEQQYAFPESCLRQFPLLCMGLSCCCFNLSRPEWSRATSEQLGGAQFWLPVGPGLWAPKLGDSR